VTGVLCDKAIRLMSSSLLSCSLRNSDFNFHPSFNVDNNLLDYFRRGIEVNQTLVNSHFEAIPCFTTLTAGGLASGNFQDFGGQADWALNTKLLGLSSLNQFLADFLQGGDFAAREGNADLVDFRPVAEILLGLLERHNSRSDL